MCKSCSREYVRCFLKIRYSFWKDPRVLRLVFWPEVVNMRLIEGNGFKVFQFHIMSSLVERHRTKWLLDKKALQSEGIYVWHKFTLYMRVHGKCDDPIRIYYLDSRVKCCSLVSYKFWRDDQNGQGDVNREIYFDRCEKKSFNKHLPIGLPSLREGKSFQWFLKLTFPKSPLSPTKVNKYPKINFYSVHHLYHAD